MLERQYTSEQLVVHKWVRGIVSDKIAEIEHREEIAQLPTVKMPAIEKTSYQDDIITFVSVDDEGRTYVQVSDLSHRQSPLDLVKHALREYSSLTQSYPSEIRLCEFLFKQKPLDAYYTRDTRRILYMLAENADFCVMVV